MTRLFFRTIALLTLLTLILCTSPLLAQFKINLPKIPKITKEKPSTGGNGDVSSPSAPTSTSVPSRDSQPRDGVAIPGARISFSATPFTDGSGGGKVSFTSADFIYGRLDLGQSIYDAFGMKGFGNKDFYYLNYGIDVEANGERTYYDLPNVDPILITKDVAKQTFLNFDVLPDPGKVTTVAGRIADDRSYYFDPAPMYYLVNESNARRYFPKTGTYKVKIRLDLNNFDEWGKMENDREKFPAVVSEFTFQFSAKDAPTLAANQIKASESAQTARNKQDTLRALPDWWGKNRGPADAKLSAARLTAFLNGRASRNNSVYLNKFAWASYSAVWTIFKDQYGLPNYRYSPNVWAVYKNNKDGLCYYGWHVVREDYSGAGTYGQAYLSPLRDETYIDCVAVR